LLLKEACGGLAIRYYRTVGPSYPQAIREAMQKLPLTDRG